MTEYEVVVHCRKIGAIGICDDMTFIVKINKPGVPTRLDIIDSWELQHGCLRPDKNGYELHHVVSWKKVD